MQSGGETGRFQLPCSGSQIALSADGLRLLVFDSDKGLLLWDTATKSRLAVLDAPSSGPDPHLPTAGCAATAPGFTPGDRYVYAIGGDKLWIWKARPERRDRSALWLRPFLWHSGTHRQLLSRR